MIHTTATTPELGVFENVPMEEYLRWPGAHVSRLTTLRDRSPAHVRYEMDHPEGDTPATLLGTAIHTAVLEPDAFASRYLRGPDGPWNKNPWAAESKAMKEANPDKTVMKAEDFDLCQRVRGQILAHPRAKALLKGAKHEVSARWKDPGTGGLCCARFDIVSPAGALADLKKTRDASPRGFLRAVYQYGYDMQAAHYLTGAKELGIEIPFGFAFVCFEAEEPNGVAVYDLSQDFLDKAWARLRPLIEQYHECERSGVWPGYPDKCVTLDPAPWDMPRDEEED